MEERAAKSWGTREKEYIKLYWTNNKKRSTYKSKTTIKTTTNNKKQPTKMKKQNR